MIGLQAPILRKIDIDPTSQFFELLSTNGWLVDIFVVWEKQEKKFRKIDLKTQILNYSIEIHTSNISGKIM